MKNVQIIRRIFKENENLNFITKCYLCQDYMKNLNEIKKKNGLGYINMMLYMKFNKDEQKVNKTEIKRDLQLPDFEKELLDIKAQILRKRIENIKFYFLKYLQILDIRHLLDLKNSQNNVQKLFAFMSRQIEIYKKSIQELVEGQREVTQNKSFVFEDGDTVKDKTDRFDSKITEYFNIQDHVNKLKNANKNKFN